MAALNNNHKHRGQTGTSLVRILIPIVIVVLFVVAVFKFLPNVLPGSFGQADRFNVAVDGPRNLVVSISTTGKEAVVVSIPRNLYLSSVAHGYGQYPISKVYSVGELDHRGGQVYLDSLSQYLGVPIDGFVHDFRNFDGLKQYFFTPSFIFSNNSNLSVWDKIKISQVVGGLRFDKIKQIDLTEVTEKTRLADGSRAVTIDPETIDSTIADSFSEESVTSEKLRVSLFNSTEVAGLGEKASRVLGNIGVTVVNVDSDNQRLRACELSATEKLMTSLTAKRIAAIFHCNVVKMSNVGRSDLIVRIGQDYADTLEK